MTKDAKVSITSVKGFDTDLRCREFQFESGKSYSIEGKVKACHNGFHACEYPLDCFNYYAPALSRYFEVEQSGETDRDGSDTKIASATITIGLELSIGDIVARAVKWIWDRATLEPGNQATGDRGAASSTGDQGAASSTGYQGAASSTGDRGAASSTGYRGAASSTGYQGAASSTGYRGAASSTGDRGAASSTGDRGAASSTRDRGAASSTGDRGAASSTGDQGAASSTGYQGAASSTGDRGAASSTGYQGAASSTGKSSVALATGYEGRAMASETSAICLVHRDDDMNIVAIRASKVGENGIKAGVWYMLSAKGEFVECDGDAR